MSYNAPPGRPIVAGMNGLSSGLSDFNDYFFQPLVKDLPAYIRDSGPVLDTLAKYKWQDNYLWMSLDVESLYTLIPHEGGLRVLQHFLAKHSSLPTS